MVVVFSFTVFHISITANTTNWALYYGAVDFELPVDSVLGLSFLA
jgi:hypothetical protein